MEILVTNNLTKIYKGFYAVKGVNMHINEGDIYGFVGENGAGKTTIIRLITGLAKPSEGSFKLFEIENTDSKIYEVKKQMAGIIEAPSLSISMTAQQNLLMQAMLAGIEISEQEINDTLTKVGLDVNAIGKKKVGAFSLGMRQRLAIAVTLINNPKFIILDEPMNGLDPQGFIEVRDLILKLNKEDGVTFLISSHMLSELEKVATKVGFISHGILLEEITMEDLHKKGSKRVVITLTNETDTSKVTELLSSKLKASDMKVKANVVEVYDAIEQAKIMKVLVNEDIAFISVNVVEETIEDYYLSVMNRGKEEK